MSRLRQLRRCLSEWGDPADWFRQGADDESRASNNAIKFTLYFKIKGQQVLWLILNLNQGLSVFYVTGVPTPGLILQ
jgi:hypothetical protein